MSEGNERRRRRRRRRRTTIGRQGVVYR